MLALTAQCTQTSLISFDEILISYDVQDGISYIAKSDFMGSANHSDIFVKLIGQMRNIDTKSKLNQSLSQSTEWFL